MAVRGPVGQLASPKTPQRRLRTRRASSRGLLSESRGHRKLSSSEFQGKLDESPVSSPVSSPVGSPVSSEEVHSVESSVSREMIPLSPGPSSPLAPLAKKVIFSTQVSVRQVPKIDQIMEQFDESAGSSEPEEDAQVRPKSLQASKSTLKSILKSRHDDSPSSQSSDESLLNDIYLGIVDPATIANLDAVLNMACQVLETPSASLCLQAYVSLNAALRCKDRGRAISTQLLFDNANTLAVYAKRDLVAFEASTSPLDARVVPQIIHVVDYLFFAEDIAVTLDSDLVKWFLARGLAVLEDHASSRYLVTAYLHLFNNQRLPRPLSTDIALRLLIAVTERPNFSSAGVTSEYVATYRTLIDTCSPVMAQNAPLWVPVLLTSLVDPSPVVRQQALLAVQDCTHRLLGDRSIARAAIKVFNEPIKDAKSDVDPHAAKLYDIDGIKSMTPKEMAPVKGKDPILSQPPSQEHTPLSPPPSSPIRSDSEDASAPPYVEAFVAKLVSMISKGEGKSAMTIWRSVLLLVLCWGPRPEDRIENWPYIGKLMEVFRVGFNSPFLSAKISAINAWNTPIFIWTSQSLSSYSKPESLQRTLNLLIHTYRSVHEGKEVCVKALTNTLHALLFLLMKPQIQSPTLGMSSDASHYSTVWDQVLIPVLKKYLSSQLESTRNQGIVILTHVLTAVPLSRHATSRSRVLSTDPVLLSEVPSFTAKWIQANSAKILKGLYELLGTLSKVHSESRVGYDLLSKAWTALLGSCKLFIQREIHPSTDTMHLVASLCNLIQKGWVAGYLDSHSAFALYKSAIDEVGVSPFVAKVFVLGEVRKSSSPGSLEQEPVFELTVSPKYKNVSRPGSLGMSPSPFTARATESINSLQFMWKAMVRQVTSSDTNDILTEFAAFACERSADSRLFDSLVGSVRGPFAWAAVRTQVTSRLESGKLDVSPQVESYLSSPFAESSALGEISADDIDLLIEMLLKYSKRDFKNSSGLFDARLTKCYTKLNPDALHQLALHLMRENHSRSLVKTPLAISIVRVAFDNFVSEPAKYESRPATLLSEMARLMSSAAPVDLKWQISHEVGNAFVPWLLKPRVETVPFLQAMYMDILAARHASLRKSASESELRLVSDFSPFFAAAFTSSSPEIIMSFLQAWNSIVSHQNAPLGPYTDELVRAVRGLQHSVVFPEDFPEVAEEVAEAEESSENEADELIETHRSMPSSPPETGFDDHNESSGAVLRIGLPNFTPGHFMERNQDPADMSSPVEEVVNRRKRKTPQRSPTPGSSLSFDPYEIEETPPSPESPVQEPAARESLSRSPVQLAVESPVQESIARDSLSPSPVKLSVQSPAQSPVMAKSPSPAASPTRSRSASPEVSVAGAELAVSLNTIPDSVEEPISEEPAAGTEVVLSSEPVQEEREVHDTLPDSQDTPVDVDISDSVDSPSRWPRRTRASRSRSHESVAEAGHLPSPASSVSSMNSQSQERVGQAVVSMRDAQQVIDSSDYAEGFRKRKKGSMKHSRRTGSKLRRVEALGNSEISMESSPEPSEVAVIPTGHTVYEALKGTDFASADAFARLTKQECFDMEARLMEALVQTRKALLAKQVEGLE